MPYCKQCVSFHVQVNCLREPISAYRVVISVASSARSGMPRNPTQTSAYPDYLHIVYTCHTTISLLFFESMAEEDFAKFYFVFPLYN